MKKLLVIFLILLSLPCFAGNLLQQEDEVRFAREIAKAQEPFPNYSKQYLVKQDYEAYYNGGDSVYGLVINTTEDISKTNILNKELNLHYLNLAKDKMQIIATTPQNSNINPAKSKIVIDDTDYKKLDKEVKNIILIVNILFE